METQMEPQPQKKSNLLLRLALLLGIPIVLLVGVPTIISVPDQVRPLPVSDNPFESILPAEKMKQVRQLAAKQPETTATQASLLEIARSTYTFPDVSSLPAERREEARQFQAKMCAMIVEYLMLVERTRHLPFDEAYKQLHQQMMEKDKIFWIKASKNFSGADRKVMKKLSEDLWRAALTGIYVERGRWLEAAQINIGEWDKAVYYLRQDGIKGRGVLVLWSVVRRIWPERFSEEKSKN